MLDATMPLPQRPDRIIVAGTSGSGKTTVAGQIGALLGIPHIEIDALFHGPDWQPRPSFLADVMTFTAGPRWVVEWQYPSARPPLRAFFTDPEHIVRWAWRMHPRDRYRVAALRAQLPDLTVVQLRSREEISDWLSGPLTQSASGGA